MGLLGLGCDAFEEMHIALIGCRDVECDGAERRIARGPEEPRRVAHRERWTVGPGEMRCDEAGGSRRAAHLIDEFGRRAVAAPARILFEWNDHVTDERRGALDKAFGGFGHLALLPASAAPLDLITRRVS